MKMKKLLICLLAGIMLLGLAACSGQDSASTSQGDQENISSAVDLLNQVWDSYAEDEKFAAAGGDYNNSVMDAPGTFDFSDTAVLEQMLYVPQEEAAKIDDAALLMHMMNANNFTAGAFHMADIADVDGFAQTMRDTLMSVQWMCGFPDKLLIVSVGDGYVVSAFGNEELMDTFKEKLTAQFSSASILFEEYID
jgi:hypothetical protein